MAKNQLLQFKEELLEYTSAKTQVNISIGG